MAHVRLGAQGRLVIPAPLRRELGVATGDELVAWVEAGRLMLEPRERVIAGLRGMFSAPPGEVDRFIEERRAEGARESARLSSGQEAIG